MRFPPAIDPTQVGEYPALTKSGGGYFYDHVLEYRVWCHPEKGSPDHHDGGDYFYAFATYDEALALSQSTEGAEEPLVLVRQLEWIDEPQDGQYIHEKGERITEWRVEWLTDGPRKPNDIENFIKK
ncbi:GCN5 family acetyltransferase [Jeongeupia wiesaeckerbachi]|uniref:GCN5 family acetyltransferase n=1 Tax=Jeongeupia wiesaeckerbachi TaxID=3051218 RepID=UPI003D803021